MPSLTSAWSLGKTPGESLQHICDQYLNSVIFVGYDVDCKRNVETATNDKTVLELNGKKPSEIFSIQTSFFKRINAPGLYLC